MLQTRQTPLGAARLALRAAAIVLGTAAPCMAETAPPRADALITSQVVEDIRALLDNELVQRSIAGQNAQRGDLAQAEIDALDAQWRAETEADDKPLIAMTLSSPLSSYLTRVQANALGLYAAIFVMDRNGLNVGQSAITGDYWQGDEAKYQKTFPVGADAVFVDEPEWIDDFGTWIAQVSLTLSDDRTGAPIGMATFDVNLAELERRAVALAN
jgi:hypothetical protein